MPGATEPAHIVKTQGYTILQSSIVKNNGSGDNSRTSNSSSGGSDNRISSEQTIRLSHSAFANNTKPPHASNPLLKSPIPLDFSSPPRLAWIPSLSVQQLVDCDTSFNRGCNGGSPLYAFRFIASKGLVPWSRYEYEEKVSIID